MKDGSGSAKSSGSQMAADLEAGKAHASGYMQPTGGRSLSKSKSALSSRFLSAGMVVTFKVGVPESTGVRWAAAGQCPEEPLLSAATASLRSHTPRWHHITHAATCFCALRLIPGAPLSPQRCACIPESLCSRCPPQPRSRCLHPPIPPLLTICNNTQPFPPACLLAWSRPHTTFTSRNNR